MSPKDVLAVCYDRGLRPVLPEGESPELGWDGDPAALTPSLRRVLAIHEAAILKLLAEGWEPRPLLAAEPAALGSDRPSADARPFDHDAEKAVRDLYALNAGIMIYPCGKMEVLRNSGTNLAILGRVLDGIRPLRQRIARHLEPNFSPVFSDPYHYGEKHEDGRVVGRRWSVEFLHEFDLRGVRIRHTYVRLCDEKDAAHPFLTKPIPQASAWRYMGEGQWRAIWGRWKYPSHDEPGDRIRFVPYGKV